MKYIKPNRLRMLVPLSAVALITFGTTLVHADNGDDASAVKGAWQPRDEDRSAFRDITDYNIFKADRRRIAERVDKQRNPPQPSGAVTTRPEPVEQTPADPDTRYRLTGISHDAAGPIAYIEDTATGKVSRVQGPADFSQGKITVIGYETLVYVVDDDPRRVSIGQNLTGQVATPTNPVAGDRPSSSGADAPKPGSREAILKAMRERRERELGNRQPAPPQPAPDPELKPEFTEQPPAEHGDSTSEQSTDAETRSTPTDADNQ